MTKENLQEIEKYLNGKNLSSTVFVEVFDHFVLQISSLMQTEKISFQEAFIQTKTNWQSELTMVKADLFSFKKIARIEKQILQYRFRKMIILAFVFSMISGIVFSMSENIYLFAQGSLIGFYFLFLIYHFIFKKMSFSEYTQMSFHPLLLRNILLILILLPALNIIFSTTKNLWELTVNHMALTFSVMIQIQLLYYRTRKINVLLS